MRYCIFGKFVAAQIIVSVFRLVLADVHELILAQCTISIPPENVIKAKYFLRFFRGYRNETLAKIG